MKKNKTRTVEFLSLVGPKLCVIGIAGEPTAHDTFPASQEIANAEPGFYLWSGTLTEGKPPIWKGEFTRATVGDLTRFGLMDMGEAEFRAGPDLTLDELKVEYIKYILPFFGGHRGKAAEHLNISVKTIYNLTTKPEKEEKEKEHAGT